MNLSKSSPGMTIFKSINFNNSTALGTCGRHSFPSGYGVSVCRIGGRFGYSHAYEVMLTYNDKLLHDESTPLTYGDSVRFDSLGGVIDLIEQAAKLPPRDND